jgi:hypothetical protein
VAGCSPCAQGAGGPLLLAACVPEAKGSPGFVAIYDVAKLDKGGDPPTPVARRSFFRVRCPCPLREGVVTAQRWDGVHLWWS